MSENRRYTDLNSENFSPRSTTNNTNINFYIQASGPVSVPSER